MHTNLKIVVKMFDIIKHLDIKKQRDVFVGGGAQCKIIIHSYLSHGTILWSSTYSYYLNYIHICQKKAVRCIFKSSYNSHTDPLFQRVES